MGPVLCLRDRVRGTRANRAGCSQGACGFSRGRRRIRKSRAAAVPRHRWPDADVWIDRRSEPVRLVPGTRRGYCARALVPRAPTPPATRLLRGNRADRLLDRLLVLAWRHYHARGCRAGDTGYALAHFLPEPLAEGDFYTHTRRGRVVGRHHRVNRV